MTGWCQGGKEGVKERSEGKERAREGKRGPKREGNGRKGPRDEEGARGRMKGPREGRKVEGKELEERGK